MSSQIDTDHDMQYRDHKPETGRKRKTKKNKNSESPFFQLKISTCASECNDTFNKYFGTGYKLLANVTVTKRH